VMERVVRMMGLLSMRGQGSEVGGQTLKNEPSLAPP